MKTFTKLALVAAVSAVSLPALALSPAQITTARNANTLTQVDVSGASATTQVLQDVMVAICDPASAISHYRDVESASSPGKRFNSYACKVDGKNVLISNQSPGSIEGVVPVMNLEPVEFMNVEAGNCASAGTNGAVQLYNCTVSDTSPNRIKRWFCGGTDTTATSGLSGGVFSTKQTRCSVPVAGVSDEEPSTFASGVNSDGGDSLDVSPLTSAPLFIQPFAPVISQTFARALIAEGKVTPVQPNGQRYPILSKAFIRSAFATGSKVRASDAAPSLLDNADEYAAYEQSGLVVCRRALGSGTHVAQNLFYMASPCKAPVAGDVLFDEKDGDYNESDLSSAGAAFLGAQHITLEGQGSSDMELCYENAESGALADALNGGVPFQFVTDGLPLSAIGYQSFGKKKTGAGEGKVISGTEPAWQYVATNGVAPTILNAANGFHTHYWEATLNWKTGTPNADQMNVLNKVSNAAGTTTAIAAAGAGAKILAKTGVDVTAKTAGSLANAGLRIRFTRASSCSEPLPNASNPVDSTTFSTGFQRNALGSPELLQDADMY